MSDSDLRGPRGGVGTMTRPAAGPRAGLAAPPRVRPQRPARPRPPAEPARRPGQPGGPAAPDAGRGAPRLDPQGAAPSGAALRGGRMPFFLLLCVLLGGALICTLLISTTLAAGSYRITRLQQSDDALARQRQSLQVQVAQAQSAQAIEQRAEQLGMQQAGELRFLNLKTGKVETDAGSGAVAAINVPGYTP